MAAIPSMGRSGLVTSIVDLVRVAWGTIVERLSLIWQTAKGRRTRRAAAIGNLVVLACLGASQLPRTGFDPQGFASVMAPAVDAGPWLLMLLVMSSAAASAVLLTSEYPASPPAPAARGEPVLSFNTPVTDFRNRDRDDPGVRIDRMGHDLRTPLTAIIGFSDMMRCELHGPLGSDRYQSYAGHIKDSGVSLLHALETAMAVGERANDVVSLARPDGGTPTPEVLRQ